MPDNVCVSWLSCRIRTLLPIAAALAIAAVFIFLNKSAWGGYFQDDELDNLTWAPITPASTFIAGLIDPRFQVRNFRPTGSLYFALMGRAAGLHFPPYVTAIFAIHLLNGILLYWVIRKLDTGLWYAIGASAFFVLSAAAFDAYWKPMYVFDLLCTTFSLLSILLYSMRRWILSFLAFWMAYKAKELAVMLPAVLAAYEYWFGERRVLRLVPFVAASLNFGIEGVLFNPNKHNDYAFHYSLNALRSTVPFYAKRILLFPFSGIVLLFLAGLRDRRVWFGLGTVVSMAIPLLFLPGRMFEAYTYLPLTGAAIALAAAATHWNPAWSCLAFALWLPLDSGYIRRESRDTLARDERVRAFVSGMGAFVEQNPTARILVFSGAPDGFHPYGVKAAWNLFHLRSQPPAYWYSSPEGRQALSSETVAFSEWNPTTQTFDFTMRRPELLK